MSGSAKELFEELGDQYDEIYERMVEFHHSPLGMEHKEVLGNFIHSTNRLVRKVGRALHNGELPERGELNELWSHHYNLRTNMGIMELILKMGKEE